ncbi:hypothetical protein WS67_15100 [Burkholderia singularis]|uniref:Uncharacterized protein n=1 Tax=Burkholderia singularis TaxID=1503053 RepID=A0A124P8Z5_9BURK|nr:hypothetical protein WS67_15100 [Burkholderia singularis]
MRGVRHAALSAFGRPPGPCRAGVRCVNAQDRAACAIAGLPAPARPAQALDAAGAWVSKRGLRGPIVHAVQFRMKSKAATPSIASNE